MRERYLKTTVLLFLFTAISTEALSYFHLIKKATSILIVLIWVCSYSYLLFKTKAQLFTQIKKVRNSSRLETIMLCIILGILLLTLFLSLYFPPSNWDSMTYHLSRVLFWIKNGSVEHYATSNPRQLYSGPFSEYCITHLYLIFNNDYLVNLVQWFSYLNIAITISLILKKWNVDYKNQLLGIILFLTLPIAILESTTTQNDLFLSQFVIICVYFIFNYKDSSWNTLFIFTSLGLAILTKATSFIFILPFLIYFIYSLIKSNEIIRRLKYLILGGLISISINFCFFQRNIDLYGDPMGMKEGKFLSNQTLGIKETISNAIRNISWQLSGQRFFIKNETILEATKKIHGLLNIDINSPNTTFGDSFYLCINNMITSEDYASNPFHLSLIFLCIILYMIFAKKANSQFAFILCTIASFLFFCFYLKWQPYHSRLLSTVFALFIPFVIYTISLMTNNTQKNFRNIILVSLLVLTPQYFLLNETKPLKDWNELIKKNRLELTFIKRPYLYENYKNAIFLIEKSKCNKISIEIGYEDWGYPLLKFIEKNTFFYQANVTNNVSSKYMISDYPCLKIKIDNSKNICQVIN